jgi:hypothetical protein
MFALGSDAVELWVVCPGRLGKTDLMRLASVQGRLGLGLVLGALSVVAAGCGDDEDSRVTGTPEPDHAREVERNPYAVTCGDLARQTAHPDSARLVIHAEFALARDPALRKVVAKQTLNRTGRSVYYALTEICKGREPAFRPARLAVEGVRQGRYRAAEGRPG